MPAGKALLLVVLLSAGCLPLYAQKNKAQLQREKQQNQEKIKETEKILNETSTKKKNSVGELNAVNQRITEQEGLVNSIKGEVRLLDGEIGENNDIIRALEDDLTKLKKEYSKMLYAAQKAQNSTTRLTFLFSAESFDQLIMRMRYMDQYSETRKLQAQEIAKVQEALGGQVREIEGRRTEKNKLLLEEERENESLADLRRKQSTIVKALEKEEKKLRKDLAATKKANKDIEKLIDDIVAEEVRAASRTSKKSTEAAVALSSSFENNKNKFPWPCAGFVSQKFGRQSHAVLKGIIVQNNGVNIQTKEDEKVKCIFEGEVTRVAFIQAMGNTIIIKHGEYLTVYAGLKEVFVRTGQKITTNQEIGRVFSNPDGVSELRFQIFKGTTPQDPQAWLRDM